MTTITAKREPVPGLSGPSAKGLVAALPQTNRIDTTGPHRSRTGDTRPVTGHADIVASHCVDLILTTLDDNKAEDAVVIDLVGKSSMADRMIIASGRSARQVGAMTDRLIDRLKAAGTPVRVEGRAAADWVLIDAGDVIVHLFRPEVRAFYNIEKMWGVEAPAGSTTRPEMQ